MSGWTWDVCRSGANEDKRRDDLKHTWDKTKQVYATTCELGKQSRLCDRRKKQERNVKNYGYNETVLEKGQLQNFLPWPTLWSEFPWCTRHSGWYVRKRRRNSKWVSLKTNFLIVWKIVSVSIVGKMKNGKCSGFFSKYAIDFSFITYSDFLKRYLSCCFIPPFFLTSSILPYFEPPKAPW